MPSQSGLRRTESITDHIRALLSQLSAGEIHNMAIELSQGYIARQGMLDPIHKTQTIKLEAIPIALCEALSRFAAHDPHKSQTHARQEEESSDEQIRRHEESRQAERERQQNG